MPSCSRKQLGGRSRRRKQRGGCGCSGGSNKQLGGSSVAFPATAIMDGHVRTYGMNTYANGGDPTYTATQSRLLGGASRSARRQNHKRITRRRMRGGNLLPLLGNPVINSTRGI